MNDEIRHKGKIEAIVGEHVTVRIVQTSACLHCKIVGHCNSAESKEKIVDVWTKHAGQYSINQEVIVVIGGKIGLKAVLLAFVVPVMIALVAIWTTLKVTSPIGVYPLDEPINQGMAAITGLLTFVVYYVGLYFFRDSLQRKFRFRIEEK